MPRFVLLKHTLPEASDRVTHWDLMLESDGTLRTWALESEPTLGASVAATQLADHRLDYLHYEGDISGNRGSVVRVDQGTYTLLIESDRQIELQLCGTRHLGRARLLKQEISAGAFSSLRMQTCRAENLLEPVRPADSFVCDSVRRSVVRRR